MSGKTVNMTALAAPTPPFQVKSVGQSPGGTPLVTSASPTGLAPATIGAVYNLDTGLVAPRAPLARVRSSPSSTLTTTRTP